MGKRMLILACVMMVLFGSALSVSAEEITTPPAASYAYRIYANQGTIGPNYSKEWSRIYEGTLTTNYQACFIFSEVYESEKYPEIKGQYRIRYFLPEYAVLGNANVVVGGSYEVKVYDKYSTKTGTLQEDMTVTAEFTNVDIGYVIGTDGTFSTNIPIFESEEDALAYFLYGDTSGMLNDIYDGMLEDNTFGLTGFTADNTITANWTGTTHDDVIDTYHKAKVGIRPAYSLKSYPGQIAKVGVVLQEYDIADKTFTKLYEELAPADDNLFLRYLEVIPNYQKEPLSSMYVGRSCEIWFNADGTIEKVVNNYKDVEPEVNTDFYLLNVVCKDTLGDIAGDNISWSGTTHDAIISTLTVEDTEIQVYCSFTDYEGKNSFDEIHKINPDFQGGSSLRIRYKIDDVSHGFQFHSKKAVDYGELWGKTFTGYVYLMPSYTKNSNTVKGLTAIVDVYNNEVRYVEDFDPKDPDTPINPIDPNNPSPVSPLPDEPEIDEDFDIADIFNYFLQLLNWLKNNIGQIPNLLGAVFPMLPKEINYFIEIGFVVVIFLRIIGR